MKLRPFVIAMGIMGLLYTAPALSNEEAAPKKGAAPAEVNKKKQKRQRWCCMVEGAVALQGSKEICVNSRKEPSVQSKSKLVKKMAKSCKGTWEVDGAEGADEGAVQ